LPASALRSAPLEMTGSGIGSLPHDRIVGAIDELLQAAAKTRFQIETKKLPLSEVERAWPGESCDPRIVFTVR